MFNLTQTKSKETNRKLAGEKEKGGLASLFFSVCKLVRLEPEALRVFIPVEAFAGFRSHFLTAREDHRLLVRTCGEHPKHHVAYQIGAVVFPDVDNRCPIRLDSHQVVRAADATEWALSMFIVDVIPSPAVFTVRAGGRPRKLLEGTDTILASQHQVVLCVGIIVAVHDLPVRLLVQSRE